MDQNDIKQKNIIRWGIKGKGYQKGQQGHGPKEDHPAIKQLNIFVIISFSIHIAFLS